MKPSGNTEAVVRDAQGISLSGLVGVGCLFWLALGVAGLAGCAEPAASDGSSGQLVQVRFALKADSATGGCPSAVAYPDVKSVRLRLFSGSPASPDSVEPFFDTSNPSIAADGCLSFVHCTNPSVRIDEPGGTQASRIAECKAAGGTTVEALEINVTDVAPSSDVTAYLEAFSDESCSDRVFVGVRGGIDIQAGSNVRGYFIQPLCVGHFTELPNPDTEDVGFIRSVAGTTCSTDCDCIDAFSQKLKIQCSADQKTQSTLPGAPLQCKSGTCTTGHAFEDVLTTQCTSDEACTNLYPSSTCGQDGLCRLTSYYPLNMRAGRAFHTATQLNDGRVLLLGGLSRKEPVGGKTAFLASDQPMEVYDPLTGTFDTYPITAASAGALTGSEARRAFHTATPMRDGKFLAVAGGVQEVSLAIATDGGQRKLQITTPDITVLGEGSNMLSNLLLLDTNSMMGRLKALGVDSGGTRTPQPFAMHAASPVLSHATEELFVVGGIAPDGTPVTGCEKTSTAPYADVATNCQVGDPTEASCKVNPCVLHAPRAGAGTACFSTSEDGICSEFAVIGGTSNTKDPVGEVFHTPADPKGSGSFAPLSPEGADELRLAKFPATVSDPAGHRVFWFGGTVSESFGDPANVATYELKLGGTEDARTLVATKSDTSALVDPTSALRAHLQATELETGDILITGGLNSKNESTSSALQFDPAGNAYRAGELKMVRSRFGHRATRIMSGLLKGAVLVTGGLTLPAGSKEPVFTPTAEIYIPQ